MGWFHEASALTRKSSLANVEGTNHLEEVSDLFNDRFVEFSRGAALSSGLRRTELLPASPYPFASWIPADGST